MKSTPTMNELFAKYPTDKNTRHRYGPFYETLFAFIPTPERILEVGVFMGASLAVWRERFPDAFILGVDRTDMRKYAKEEPMIVGDAYIKRKGIGSYDLIIEDGSHAVQDQRTFINLVTWQGMLNAGGTLIIEDVVHPDKILIGLREEYVATVIDFRKGADDPRYVDDDCIVMIRQNMNILHEVMSE